MATCNWLVLEPPSLGSRPAYAQKSTRTLFYGATICMGMAKSFAQSLQHGQGGGRQVDRHIPTTTSLYI